MHPKAAAEALELHRHLPPELAASAQRESRSQPQNANLMTLRELVTVDHLAHVSASNILELAKCGIRDVERVRGWGAGVAVIEAFAIANKRLPITPLELAQFIQSLADRHAS